MAKKQKPEQKTTAHTSKYADVLTGTVVEVPEGHKPPETHPLKVEPEAPEGPAPDTGCTVLSAFPPWGCQPKTETVQEHPLRELPKGMNKFNSTNEFLMLILESLYRIERKMGA